MASDPSHLALVEQGLVEVPLDAATRYGPTATTVNLTENRITSLANLRLFTRVETLILDKNGMETLEGCPTLPTVTTLWFNNNRVSDIVDFMDAIAAAFPNLVYLTLMQNPASPPLVLMSEEDVAKETRFRLYVIYRLPKLQFLNASPVSAAERVEAGEKGQYMAVRKPKRVTSGGADGPSATTTTTASGAGDAANLFFGGPAAGSPAAASAMGDGGVGSEESGSSTKPSAFISLGSTHYDGRHSEGNRFIMDRDL